MSASAKLNQSGLDEFQRAFCSAETKALRLLAPAGSGKTYSILWRCLNHYELAGVEKPRFLLFTFTRAARDELKDRLGNDGAFTGVAPFVEVSTLNSWGYRRLKSKKFSLRLLSGSKDTYFCVQNTLQPVWQKHQRLREALTNSRAKNRAAKTLIDIMDRFKTLGFRHDVHHEPDRFVAHVDWLSKNGMLPHLQSVVNQLTDIEVVQPVANGNPLVEIFKHFLPFWVEACDFMFATSQITLEDQKYWALLDLEQASKEGRFTTGMHRFHHVIVDEFQDINKLDLELLRSIAANNKAELTIVGDDDQAIYEWRGASPVFITKPEQQIAPDYATCILEINYRSPRNIVELSQKLIQHNKKRVPKNIRPASKDIADVRVSRMPSLSHSLEYVLTHVRQMLANPAIKKVAIIGRKRSQIIPYQITFARENIPFYAAEDLQVFLSDAFGDLKEMLAIKARAGSSPIPGFDAVADLLKLVNKVKRFPLNKSDLQHLTRYLQQERPRTLIAALDCLRRYQGPLKGGNDGGRMSESFFLAIAPLLHAKTVSDAIRVISLSFEGLQKDYGKSVDDIFYADPPFLYLADYAARYGDQYAEFYEDIEKAIATLARVTPDNTDAPQDNSWKLPLHLMTALRAKGKEFDAVIILDANRDIWPSRLAETEDQLEQERRVFYVAFTRARKQLTLLVNDSMLGIPAAPSPYIAEMGLIPQPLAIANPK